jgi:hypothetical protein
MELVESLGWIMVGFMPTLLSLEIGYRIGARTRRLSVMGRERKLLWLIDR